MILTVEDEDGVDHVVRCNEEGEISPPHILSQYCCCLPDIEFEDGVPTIYHNEIH